MSNALEYIIAAATVTAACATAWAAFAARSSSKSAKEAVELQQRSEQSRVDLQKKELLIKNFQMLISTFAEIKVIAKDDDAPDRSPTLKSLARQLRYYESIIQSLSPQLGSKLHDWSSKEIEGYSNPRLISYVIGFHNAHIGNKYDAFFDQKIAMLIEIQDEIFKI